MSSNIQVKFNERELKTGSYHAFTLFNRNLVVPNKDDIHISNNEEDDEKDQK